MEMDKILRRPEANTSMPNTDTAHSDGEGVALAGVGVALWCGQTVTLSGEMVEGGSGDSVPGGGVREEGELVPGDEVNVVELVTGVEYDQTEEVVVSAGESHTSARDKPDNCQSDSKGISVDPSTHTHTHTHTHSTLTLSSLFFFSLPSSSSPPSLPLCSYFFLSPLSLSFLLLPLLPLPPVLLFPLPSLSLSFLLTEGLGFPYVLP